MKSKLKEIGRVRFPKHTGERVYMLPFKQREGLPKYLSRWQPTVDAMLKGIQTDNPIYLMIDQGEVKAGQTHRRGGAHIDGNWLPDINAHSGGEGGGGRHSTTPEPNPEPTKPGWSTDKPDWKTSNLKPESLILAASVSACKAYVGEIKGEPGKGGDCSRLNLSKAKSVRLKSGRAYIGNVTMVHESVPVRFNCKRTVVRLNLPGVTF